jgi:hypothetical protein
LFNLALAEFSLADASSALPRALECLAICRHVNREGTAWCLVLLGAMADRRGETETAARLLAAAEGLRDEFGLAFGPAEARLHERTVEAVRAKLSGERLNALWAEGTALSEDQAADYAVSALGPDSETASA